MALLSIVMPVYNAEKTLPRTIRSLLDQSFGDFELLAVDDCSTDTGVEIIRDFGDKRVRLIEMKSNGGAAAARNAALDQIRGEYVTFLDADDWIENDWLSRAASILRSDASIDCLKCGCSEDYLDRDGRLAYQKLCRVEDERRSIARSSNSRRCRSSAMFGTVFTAPRRLKNIPCASIAIAE